MQNQDDTALLDAAETGLVDTVLLLLDRGVSAFTVDLSGYTALHKCSFMGFDFVAKVLVEREPRLIDACDLTHNTPLHVAAWSGHVATSIALLEAGANVSACDLAGNTPARRHSSSISRRSFRRIAIVRRIIITDGRGMAPPTSSTSY